MSYQFTIQPRDVLFFRDARPMQGSFTGHGASWPLPSVWHSAMMSTLYRQWPERQPWEKEHEHRRKKHDRNFSFSRMRFGGLKTQGPFPTLRGEGVFPTPLDLMPGATIAVPESPPEGSAGNGPTLPLLPVNPGKPSKESPGTWVSASEFDRYLQGEYPRTIPEADLFVTEPRPGVAIDRKTHGHVDGQFFAAEYLRLQEDAGLMAFADCISVDAQKQEHDIVELLLTESRRLPIQLGGQRGLAWLEAERNKVPLIARTEKNTGCRVKWVLLTPAIFRKGWCPGWVNQDNDLWHVQLKNPVKRHAGEKRRTWRDRVHQAPNIGARLVSACIGKPIPLSGWQLQGDKETPLAEHSGGGKAGATRLAVPAGSVYYFECDRPEQAARLVEALHGQNKSDSLGEQGFGLGVCASWDHQQK